MPAVIKETIGAREVNSIFRSGRNPAEGCRRVLAVVQEGIRKDKDGKRRIDPMDVSFRGLALGLEMIHPYDNFEMQLREKLYAESRSSERMRPESMLAESNPGVATNAFQIITGSLINEMVIEGYEDDSEFIGDRLVQTMSNQRLRNQKITGITALGGPDTVNEGHAYEETDFEEKYVTTSETKKGRILSINEELIVFDQTGEIANRARNLGYYLRQERERTIIRGVTDADASSGTYVYRPSGTGETLYNTDGSNYNWIGSGNTTSSTFNAAVPLLDWTDVDTLRRYRATEPTDDRIDGTGRPIAGLNGPGILLLPENKRATGDYIQSATEIRNTSGSNVETIHRTPPGVQRMIMEVLSSPFIDEQGGQAVNDWFFGQFSRQFKWTEIWPVQTFTQDGTSEAAFERDVVMRIKVRYYGGISAVDTFYVTKVDGA